MMCFLSSRKGFSTVEVLVASGVLLTAALPIALYMTQQSQLHTKNMIESKMDGLRKRALELVVDQQVWETTIAQNPGMNCLSQKPRNCQNMQDNLSVRLMDRFGQVFIDNQPNRGFNPQGEPCSGFSPVGNPRCPLRVTMQWRTSCSGGASCQFPDEVINLRFEYNNGTDDFRINTNKFAVFDFHRANRSFVNGSPVANCADVGQVFVGFNKTVNDVNGGPHTADNMGCVALSIFKGRTGFRGPRGPTGPAGARGPRGPTGPDWSGPSIPSPPVVTSTPVVTTQPPAPTCSVAAPYDWICGAYDLYLGRWPEQGAAEYWASTIASGNATSTEVIRAIVDAAQGIEHVVEGFDHHAFLQNEGIPMGSQTCATDIVSCATQTNPAAANAYHEATTAHCNANPSLCYTQHPDGRRVPLINTGP